MDFIRALPHFGTHLEPVQLGIVVSSATGSNMYYKLHAFENDSRRESECQKARMDFVRSLFALASRISPTCWLTFVHNCFQGYYKFHAYENRSPNKIECETPRMDITCAAAHLGMHFESVRVDVKLSSTVGSNGYYKLHAYEIEA